MALLKNHKQRNQRKDLALEMKIKIAIIIHLKQISLSNSEHFLNKGAKFAHPN